MSTSVDQKTEGHSIMSGHRLAFFRVMDAYNALRSTNGSSGAIAYEECFHGKPMYKNDCSFARMFDYVVDVENAIKSATSIEEYKTFKAKYFDQVDYGSVFTKDELKQQSKIGIIFRTRALYPAQAYFKGISNAYMQQMLQIQSASAPQN